MSPDRDSLSARRPVSRGAPVVGDEAPDLALPNQFGEVIGLSGLRGSKLVLVFYPFAFSTVCTSEMRELMNRSAEFDEAGAKLFAISVDSKYTLRAYSASEGIEFDLLSDFWPHGAAAEAFGVFDAERGLARRGTFSIDADGIVRDAFFSETSQARPWTEYQRAFRVLNGADD